MRAEVGLVGLPGVLLHDVDEAVEALLDHLARRRIVELSGRRTLALGIDEREHLVVADFVDEAARVLEILLGLAGEADDDVGGQRDVGLTARSFATSSR